MRRDATARFGVVWRLVMPMTLLSLIHAPVRPHSSIAYEVRTVLGQRVYVVTADLNVPHVEVMVEVARGFPARGERLHTLATRRGAIAAVNGTFFHERSYEPIGDVVVNGRVLFRSARPRPAVAVDWHGRVEILSAHQIPKLWRGYRFALVAGPRLLQQGVVVVSPESDGFRDPRVLGYARRSAVGITTHNKLLLVVVRNKVSLTRLAHIMVHLGAVDALNLDGGTSSGLYYGGRLRIAGRRAVPSALVVTVRG